MSYKIQELGRWLKGEHSLSKRDLSSNPHTYTKLGVVVCIYDPGVCGKKGGGGQKNHKFNCQIA